MAHPAVWRALQRDAEIFLGVLGAEALAAGIFAPILRAAYAGVLHWLVIATAVAILAVSAIEGTGAPEAKLPRSGLYYTSPKYQGEVTRGRIQDEQDGFWFMLVGFVWGVLFLGIGALLALVPGA